MVMSLVADKQKALAETAKAIVAEGKGILAADESTGTIGKRFSSINVENTEENRQKYRELLFTTSPKELQKYIGGVILYEETLNQKSSDGRPFAQILSENGIIVGIKVDKVIIYFYYYYLGNCQYPRDQGGDDDSRLGWLGRALPGLLQERSSVCQMVLYNNYILIVGDAY